MRLTELSMAALLMLAAFIGEGSSQEKTENTFLDDLRAQAQTLAQDEHPELIKNFLTAARTLQPIERRTIYYDRTQRTACTEKQYSDLSEEVRSGFAPLLVGDKLYFGYYSTPLAWVRPLEILAANGMKSVDSKRILDFGFGNVGQLRMLASMGADVTGIEIDGGVHEAMYSQDSDQGSITKLASGNIENDGNLKLVFGQWPASEKTVSEAGHHFDLFISKNVLKLGYIHPEQEVSDLMLIDLGASDEQFLTALFKAVNPGGLALIYNIHPTQESDPQKYKPWAHGETPWKKDAVERAGFEVVAWHVDDSAAIQAFGTKLGWNDSFKNQEDFKSGFRAMYTILKKPKK